MWARAKNPLKAGLFGLMLSPAAVAAHPHIFIDTGLTIVLNDQGEVTGVEVVWAYDALYSMLTFEDMGLDNDYDGRLDEAELGFLNGFDMNWVEGYEGDLFLEAAGDRIALGPPEPRGLIVEEARIVTTHFRPVVAPVSADGLIVRAYDPTFYTAYDLTRGVRAEGACAVQVTPADLDAAYTLVEEMLYAMPSADLEDAFPEVGEAFADTVVVRCTG